MDDMAERYKAQDTSVMDDLMMQHTETTTSRLNGAIADTVKYGYL